MCKMVNTPNNVTYCSQTTDTRPGLKAGRVMTKINLRRMTLSGKGRKRINWSKYGKLSAFIKSERGSISPHTVLVFKNYFMV